MSGTDRVLNGILGLIGLAFIGACVALATSDTQKFFTLFAAGISLGAVYALVSLGFVVVYRATGILNFAQVGFVVFGAFLTNNAIATWGWNFWPAFVFAMVGTAALAVVTERVAIRQMLGQPIFFTILLTIGIFLVLQSLVITIWSNFDTVTVVASPWTGQHKFGDVIVLDIDLATIVSGVVVFVVFFVLFRFTKLGLAMRATAIDSEAALAQGINVPRVVMASWAIAGAVAAIAGTMLAAGAGPKFNLNAAGIASIALAAFPAMILGGLDSPSGALIGGITIGVAYQLANGYQQEYFSWVGTGPGFATVLPYIIMIAVLLLRPQGLFGTAEVRRV